MEHYLNLGHPLHVPGEHGAGLLPGHVQLPGLLEEGRNRLGLGVAVVFVQVLTVPLNNLILHYLLAEGALGWLSPLAGQGGPHLPGLHPLHRHHRRGHAGGGNGRRPLPAWLYATLGVFLPLIAVNCVILGGSLFMQERDYTLAESVVFGFGSGVGFMIAIVGMAAMREKLEYSDVPAGLRGLGITFVTAGPDVGGLHGVLGHPALRSNASMNEIISGVAMFTVVVLMLVALLLVARRKLVPSGDVTITINDDPAKALKVPAGNTLLGTLGDNKIFIPSACGGKGACGVCEVIVKEGGGTLLPTETGFINRGEAKRGCRLACQVKVKRDMAIEIAGRDLQRAQVELQGHLQPQRRHLHQGTEAGAARGRGSALPCRRLCAAGMPAARHRLQELRHRAQFRDDWDKFDLWRFKSVVTEPIERAYSMANYPLEKGHAAVHHPHRLPARLPRPRSRRAS
jgi:Na+-transporting NADH:ubiquinone oxidoreductase subunit NqrE/ferredoxin